MTRQCCYFQGPVGYIPTPTFSQNWPQCPPNDAVCNRHQQDVMCHGQSQRVRDSNHRDHLSYLRSRRQPVAIPKAPLPGYMSQFLPGGGPTYADQTGRVWPVPKSGALGGPQPGWPAPPPVHTGPTVTGVTSKLKACPGHRPIYRSRSDETLSTISSHASRQRHYGKRGSGAEKSSRRTTERSRNRQDRAATNQPRVPQSVPVAAATAPSDPVPTDVATCSVPAEEHPAEVVDPAAVKSTHVDSSSNPDSGYSGASAAMVRNLAPCSESSSLRSASSGEIPAMAAVGISERSDSVPSLCGSL